MSKGYGKITIDLNDIASAIKELENAKAWIADCCEKYPKELTEEGARVAEMVFDAIPKDEQHAGSMVTTESYGSDDYRIRASGEDVVAIEFGTGVMTTPYPVENSDVPIGAGEWSKRNKMEFYDNGYWFYGGQRYTGTYPYKPMLHAGQYIRNNTAKKAKEVFNQ